ncbi:hypothetical protein LTR97_002706 [Elasticomyces elasticus]|uniref:SH3 domain-containing protein n=1 Tax=Elasticomyces elasticus TaxID=574655 RepID=A0AAN7ZV17_9PEZI|nr:hypothetical protein LTR97_002706 [Elasticomyces elasticus]
MRLLNILSLQLQEFEDWNKLPPYAIASHRWQPGEATYQDVQEQRNLNSPGHLKVLGFSELVSRLNSQRSTSRALGDLGLCWRLCINKEISAELFESVNSMFQWYGGATICYAYLADVSQSSSALLDMGQSDWFHRGWTLQELIAPRTVVLLASNWTVLGHKCAHSEQVCASVCSGFGSRLNARLCQITGIPPAIMDMTHVSQLRHIHVNEKLSWAKHRITTRPEDQAYCLLGLLDVFIAPIYGEGEHAWSRLMQAVGGKQALPSHAPKIRTDRNAPQIRYCGVRRGSVASRIGPKTNVRSFKPLKHTRSTPASRKYGRTARTIKAQAYASNGISADTSWHNAKSITPELGFSMVAPSKLTPTYTPFQVAQDARQERAAISNPGQRHGVKDFQDQLHAGPNKAWYSHRNPQKQPTVVAALPAKQPTSGCGDRGVEAELKVKALCDFTHFRPTEFASKTLAFKRGDIITVTNSTYNAWWWQGTLQGVSGILPKSHVEPLIKAATSPSWCLNDTPSVALKQEAPGPAPKADKTTSRLEQAICVQASQGGINASGFAAEELVVDYLSVNNAHGHDQKSAKQTVRQAGQVQSPPCGQISSPSSLVLMSMANSTTVAIPTIVLRALLRDKPCEAATLDEANLLASTAIDYIRCLMLGDPGACQPDKANRQTSGGHDTWDGNI